MIVNALRGLVKSAGGRLPACSTSLFPLGAGGYTARLSAVATRCRADSVAQCTDRWHGQTD